MYDDVSNTIYLKFKEVADSIVIHSPFLNGKSYTMPQSIPGISYESNYYFRNCIDTLPYSNSTKKNKFVAKFKAVTHFSVTNLLGALSSRKMSICEMISTFEIDNTKTNRVDGNTL